MVGLILNIFIKLSGYFNSPGCVLWYMFNSGFLSWISQRPSPRLFSQRALCQTACVLLWHFKRCTSTTGAAPFFGLSSVSLTSTFTLQLEHLKEHPRNVFSVWLIIKSPSLNYSSKIDWVQPSSFSLCLKKKKTPLLYSLNNLERFLISFNTLVCGWYPCANRIGREDRQLESFVKNCV